MAKATYTGEGLKKKFKHKQRNGAKGHQKEGIPPKNGM
jgi:hypothetical protein